MQGEFPESSWDLGFLFLQTSCVGPAALDLAPPVSQDTASPYPGGPQVGWGKGTAAGVKGPRQPLQGSPASVDTALSALTTGRRA